MTAIGVARDDGVVLRSCSACGRHAWSSHGQELSRAQLLKVLRESSPPASKPGPKPASKLAARPAVTTSAAARAPKPVAAPPRPAAVTSTPRDHRGELKEMLRGFTVHGRTS